MPFYKVKWQHFEGVCGKFYMHHSGNLLSFLTVYCNSITDEVTTRNTTAYFFGPLCIVASLRAPHITVMFGLVMGLEPSQLPNRSTFMSVIQFNSEKNVNHCIA